MTTVNLQWEINVRFEEVARCIANLEAVYGRITKTRSSVAAARLAGSLNGEIDKLQRLHGLIETWATNDDIRDKAPLLQRQKLIETKLDYYHTMKTGTKPGNYLRKSAKFPFATGDIGLHELSALRFLGEMLMHLERQIETLKVEKNDVLAATKKKMTNKDSIGRYRKIEYIIERHMWHVAKLEVTRRCLLKGHVSADQVNQLEESIRYYVAEGTNDDLIEDDMIYDELHLEDVEEDDYDDVDDDNDVNQENESRASSSFGSIDSGVSHPPRSQREGKKIVGMKFSEFINRVENAVDEVDGKRKNDARFWAKSEDNTGNSSPRLLIPGRRPGKTWDADATRNKNLSTPASRSEVLTWEGVKNKYHIDTKNHLDDGNCQGRMEQAGISINKASISINEAGISMNEGIRAPVSISRENVRGKPSLEFLLPKATDPPTRHHWKYDADSAVCDEATCTRSFNYITRRHHCRKCGKVFCGPHSGFQVPLDRNANFSPLSRQWRACGDCFGEFKLWSNRMNEGANSNTDTS